MGLFFVICVFYFFYTISFAIDFNKKKLYFNRKQRRLHNILIWIIPFIWILALKTISKPVEDYKKELDPNAFHESGIGQRGAGGIN